MSVLVVADLHLAENPRDAYRLEFQKQLRKTVRDRKVQTVIILGDLTEQKDRHSAWLVNRVVEEIVALAEIAQVIVLKGNHDYLDPSCPFFGFLGRFEGVAWVNAPTSGKSLPSGSLAGLGRVLFLPHTSEYKRDWEGLKLDSHYDLIFAHNTFEGAHVGYGKIMRGIPLDLFGESPVISGDIHVPQKLGGVMYVGAPYLVDFGDDYKPRMLLLTKDKTISIPCTGPQKRLVEVGSLTELDKQKQLNAGDILEVRVSVEPGDVQRWMETHGKVRKWGEENGFVVYSVKPMVKPRKAGKVRYVSQKLKKTDSQIMEEFAKRRGLSSHVIKTGRSLMGKA